MAIPRKIWAVWITEEEKIPELIQRCIASQKIPGYEHNVITLADAEKLRHIPYVDQCLNSKFLKQRWCKLSDYLRMYYLLKEGGIYLDADVEILPGKNFDGLLHNKMFIGYERNSAQAWLGTSVLGSEAGLPFLTNWMDKVESRFRGDDNKNFASSMLLLNDNYYENHKNEKGIELLSCEYFTPYHTQNPEVLISEKTIGYHHFMISWHNEKPNEEK